MFCDWLKNSRRALGLTQQQMGQVAGVSASTVGMYEQGRRHPGPAAQAHLREFFAAHGLEMPIPPRQRQLPEKARFREVLRQAGIGR